MALEGNPGGRRRKGRSRKRRLDDVQDDMIKMDVKRWRTKAMDRGEWRKICEAAKVLQELQSHGEEDVKYMQRSLRARIVVSPTFKI
jgi:hypothetical protein